MTENRDSSRNGIKEVMGMNWRYSKVFAIMVLCAFMGTALAGGVTAEDEPYEGIEMETGTTTDYDGGDYVFVKFSKDAAFGVVYGTDENPNSIIIVAVHVRYLAAAEVYDDNGAKMGNNVPIPVVTVFAQKLEDIFEFNDTDGDGICDYRRWGFGLEYGDYFVHEPIYKRVNLVTGWDISDIRKEVDKEERSKSWEFSLTAEDLPYSAVGDSDSIDDDVRNEALDKLEFTFHLEAKMVEYNNISVPMYKVTVRKTEGDGKGMGQRNHYEVVSSERIQNREFSGTHGNYIVKYDHLIEGWDFDPTNANPHLLLEWHVLIGNMVPTKVQEWITAQFTEQIDDDSEMVVDTDKGEERYNEENAREVTSPFLESPRRVRTKHIQSGADWAKVGRLTWVSNVTVDGEEGRMYAQVQGGMKVSQATRNGNFYGFALLAGFSYPGGDKVFHDPGISNDMPVNIEFGITKDNNVKGFLFVVGLGVVIGLIAMAGVAYSLKKGKDGKANKGYYNGAYDVKRKGGKGEEWERYYKGKR